MALLRNNYFISALWLSVLLVLACLCLIISSSYFNSKEISLLTSRCDEVNGKVLLHIQNHLTNDYSFECQR